MRYKVLDTNILLLDANNLITLGKDGSTIVLSEIVLDELDSKKSQLSEIGYHAREFGRLLTRAVSKEVVANDGISVTRLDLDDTKIEVISFEKYDLGITYDSKIINDRKIIATAQHYTKTYNKDEVTFISNDVMCRLRANAMGITVDDLKEVEEINVLFTKTLHLEDEEMFRTLHNRRIDEITDEHQPNFFNYILVSDETGQVKLGTIHNNRLSIIGKDTEKELRKQDINPANMEQLFYSKALQDTSIDINICEAKAGTGKTLLAISNGIRNIRKGLYNQLIYIRASVDDVDRTEAIGFLSGNEEKMQVYLHPFEDSLDKIARKKFSSSKLKGLLLEEAVQESIESLKTQYNMQAMIGLGLRGRTFDNAFIIIDEAQNQAKSSLQKMLTRVGQNSKLVVIGSNRQIDNPYVTKYTNGLSVLIESCITEHDNINLHSVNLPKVLRGRIAEFSEDLYS